MNDTTILYITDNSLNPFLFDVCQKYLLRAAEGKRIISVSQEPISFGDNICVGPLRRSTLSIDTQLLKGLEEVKTKFTAIAEHDCIYCPEHFNFVPPNEQEFFYNANCWMLQYVRINHPRYNGVFSYFTNRCAMSQLISGSDALRRAINLRYTILSDERVRKNWPTVARIGEPGTGGTVEEYYTRFFNILSEQWENFKEYRTTCYSKCFRTVIPTIDIRHENNFSGSAKVGRYIRRVLEPWGTMDDIFKGVE